MSDEKPSLLEFPCEFPIKMMGRDSADFQTTARRIVEQHAGPVSDEAIRTSPSRNGRFISITMRKVRRNWMPYTSTSAHTMTFL